MIMKNNRFVDFHAGHFLQESLQRSGFSIEWLAEKTEYETSRLEQILAQPNMDSELFVSIGRHMGKAFFDPLDVAIFGRRPIERL